MSLVCKLWTRNKEDADVIEEHLHQYLEVSGTVKFRVLHALDDGVVFIHNESRVPTLSEVIEWLGSDVERVTYVTTSCRTHPVRMARMREQFEALRREFESFDVDTL